MDGPPVRIDPCHARLPQPSAELYRQMIGAAGRAVEEYVASCGVERGVIEFRPDLTEDIDTSAIWDCIARAMYAAVAARGGGKIQVLKGGVDG